jgi:hypothetical protein
MKYLNISAFSGNQFGIERDWILTGGKPRMR